MTNEEISRRAYHVAEIMDVKGFIACFTDDGTFTGESLGVSPSHPRAGRATGI
jgi:hypothetical protein